MRALLLAAGFGTRLRPLTDHIPKCLAPIRGTPLLAIWFDLLFGGGIDEVLVNTHYLSEQVRSFVGNSPWREKVSLVYEEQLLGTGGTVLENRDFFGNKPFLIAHADNLTLFDVRAFLKRHEERPPETAITMMTFESDAPQTCGIVEEDERSVVTAFHEKVSNPPGNHANAAVYIFEPEVITFLAGLGKRYIDCSTEVIPHFLDRIYTFHNDRYHRDIGTLDSLEKAEREFKDIVEGR